MIVGLMSWAPNKFGILWFCQKVYPLLRSKIPNLKLSLVGPNPEEDILSLDGKNGITVYGEVESLDSYYKRASVLVAPIFSGSGVRIKILHALSFGVPVLSTKIGAEGMKTDNRSGVIISDSSPIIFAENILKILNSKKESNRLSRDGIKYINKHYSDSESERIINWGLLS
ncbi:glycosyltransferase family 4 protein [Patescibacteria group bacterium]